MAAGATIRELHVQRPSEAVASAGPAPDSHSLDKYIEVRHPGYDDEGNSLFILLAPDSSTGSLHHATVHSAAGAIAYNRYDGYLSREPHGTPVPQSMHELLPYGDYYFCLPRASSAQASASTDQSATSDPPSLPYPIVPSFADWKFPHRNLPAAWSSLARTPLDSAQKSFPASQSTQAVHQRDGCCRMTGSVEGLEVCHILPYSEDDWFGSNAMSRYSRKKRTSINDTGNAFCLRGDLHATYDAGKWVAVPKARAVESAEGTPSTTLVFHLLEPSEELASLYHNVPLRATLGISPEYLFAAFVRTIFPSLNPFLRARKDRRLIGAQICPNGDSKILNGFDLANIYGAPGYRSGSSSPRKRQATSQNISGDQIPLGIPQAVQMDPLALDSRKRRRSSENCVQEEQCSREPIATSRAKRHQASTIIPQAGAHNLDGPCTCRISPITVISLASSGSDDPQDIVPHLQFCASSNCKHLLETNRLDDLRELALQRERAKSGKTKEWQELLDWAETVRQKGRMSPRSIDRWFWVQGSDHEGIGNGASDD